MKKTAFPFAAILCASIICSCGNNSESSTTTDSSTMTSTTDTSSAMAPGAAGMDTMASTGTSTAPLDKMDRDFVMKAAGGGMMEVELGNLAQQNAASQRVKDFGARLMMN